jgi:hypothetical protein
MRNEGECTVWETTDEGSDEAPNAPAQLTQALPVRGPRRPGVPHPAVEALFVPAAARLRRAAVPAAEIEFPELRAAQDFRAGCENSGRLPAPREVARYDDVWPKSSEARTESKDLNSPPWRQRRIPVAGVAPGPS